MARITCPHCSEKINLATTNAGRYQCPYCDKFFNIAKKQTNSLAKKRIKPQSVEIKQGLPSTDPSMIEIPDSAMAWHNSKLVVFTILGLYLVIQGIILFFEGFFWFDYNPIGAIFFFCGVYLLIPLMFAKQNIEDMKLEMETNALSPSSRKFKVTNSKKTAIKGILGTSIAVSTVVMIIMTILVVLFFVVVIGLFSGVFLEILLEIFFDN
tara:strand:- start:86 stop:715 length:630 start_codon:yes stop_codon:yes gene_type:complete